MTSDNILYIYIFFFFLLRNNSACELCNNIHPVVKQSYDRFARAARFLAARLVPVPGVP